MLFRTCASVAARKLRGNKYKHKEVRAVTQARAGAWQMPSKDNDSADREVENTLNGESPKVGL